MLFCKRLWNLSITKARLAHTTQTSFGWSLREALINQYVVNMWHPRVRELKAVKKAKGIIPSDYWKLAYDIKIEALQNKQHRQWAKDLTISQIYDNLLGL